MGLSKATHAVVILFGLVALGSAPGPGGPVYWGTLAAGVFGSLYLLAYVGTKGYGRLAKVVRARVA